MSPRKDPAMRLSQVPKRLKRPDPNAQVVQQLLDPLAEALVQPDEPSRAAAVARVCQAHALARVGPLLDALVELLGRDEGPVRDQAVAYLGRLGGLALPSLVLRFTRTDSPALQRGIIEALTQIAGRLDLDRARRLELLTDVAVLLRFAVEGPIRLELGKVVIAIRQANEAASRTS
jgi:HEAT repeat protein